MWLVTSWKKRVNNRARHEAQQAFNQLRASLYLLSIMDNARKRCHQALTHAALSTMEQANVVTEQFALSQDSGVETASLHGFTARFKQITAELAQHVAACGPQFLEDTQNILQHTLWLTQRFHQQGWPDYLYTRAIDQARIVQKLRQNVSAGGRITTGHLNGAHRVVVAATQIGQEVAEITAQLSQRQMRLTHLAARFEAQANLVAIVQATVAQACIHGPDIWQNASQDVLDIQGYMQQESHALLTQLRSDAQPGQTDWARFDHSMEMAEQLLEYGQKAYADVLYRAEQYLAALDSVRKDIRVVVHRITKLQTHFGRLQRDLNEVQYWLRKLLNIMRRFDRFANLPNAEWPALETAHATLAALVEMVDLVEDAARGSQTVREQAAKQLPEQIVFRTELVGFFFWLGAPETA